MAVISNGTAVLGLGNIGAVAGKPVMEGKGCLFKKFAGIDVFDIEIDETDPDKLVETIASLEPTFGGINLEDIKAPECFEIETRLRERMKIPVFHDDQHGTAIVAAAALLNALEVVGKRIEEVKLVCSGAGAAAIACLNLAVGPGRAQGEHLGHRQQGRRLPAAAASTWTSRRRSTRRTPRPARWATSSPGADVFFGLSAAGVLKPEMVEAMAERPIILAMANPDPEIRPEVAKEVRPDCIIATGRCDYPNQVNNVLCFPFIFRGALDVGATTINEEMKLACVRAIAELARADVSDVVAAAYGRQDIRFGPEYLIPPPFDPRLITTVAPAVAEAAMASGVATRPIADLKAYRASLQRYVYTSGTVMQPVFAGRRRPGDQAHRLRRGRGRPRAARGAGRGRRAAGPAGPGRPARGDPRTRRGTSACGSRRTATTRSRASTTRRCSTGRPRPTTSSAGGAGSSATYAAAEMRRNGTLIGAMLVREGRADGMLCGTFGPYAAHLNYVAEAIGLREGVQRPRGHAPPDAAAADRVRLRHLHQPRPDGRAARRHDAPGGGGGAPLRARAAGGAAVAFQLRHRRHALRAQDARGPGADPGTGARARGRGRDARGRRALQAHPRPGVPGLAA